jgi:iron complex outermembrane receptor protein
VPACRDEHPASATSSSAERQSTSIEYCQLQGDNVKTEADVHWSRFLGAVVCASFAGVPMHAQAQESGLALEEIIVTAQKRMESVQDVPISISAFSANDLSDLGVDRASELLNFIPNASTHLIYGDSQFNFYIRGVGDSNFHVNSISSVGIYADEVALNSAPTWGFATFDLERVEVLRGPQNTLFGRNTTGGAVSFISRKPALDAGLNGHVDLSYGRYNQVDVEGALGIPAGDSWAFRLAAKASTGDAIQTNRFLGVKQGDRERYAARFQALWQPSDTFSALFSANFGANRGDNRQAKSIGTQDPSNPRAICPVPLGQLGLGQPCSDGGGFVDTADHFEIFANMPNPRNQIDVSGGSLRLDWKMSGATLTSISAYMHSEMERSEDADAGPNAFFELHQGTDADQYSQELRLTSSSDSKMQWLLGAYYFFEDAYLPTVIRRTPGDPPPLNAVPGDPDAQLATILPTTIIWQDDKSASLYGQIDYELVDRLTVTAGLRLSSEDKSGWNETFIGSGTQYPFGTFLTEDRARSNIIRYVGKTRLDEQSDEWGGRLALNYRLNPDAILYGSVSRGFKSGGFSAAALQALIGQAARAVKPESLLTYEIGSKSTWLDGRLTTNVSAFYNDWQDMQIFSILLDQGQLLPLLLNVPKTASWGAEFEAKYVPAENWLVQLGLGLLDSEVKDATDLPQVHVGNELPYAPNYSVDGLIEKRWPLASGVVSLQTDFHAVADQSYDLANKVELSEDGRFLLNARLAYKVDRYEFAIWGRNLTEESYCDNKLDFRGPVMNIKCLQNDDIVWYGADFKYKF